MLKCTINGKELEVKEGTTIIQAFKQSGQDIAHYCWHPALSVAGVCRLCMVEIEGNPRPQIACNTTVTEGMKVNNKSEKVVDAVKWGLDFHLINHPLDCPICDQAGECGLQEQYMQYGQYDPEMAEPKVKKRKVIDLGPRVVLDSERCILCSRCVRFTEEVSKTNELGIFNRGDRSEIGTFDDKPLDNNYSLNTVDICPVGALTSRDFRFRQRVWFLKEESSVCPGCSTGCSIKVYYNKEGAWRVKPELNPEVNGYWMCDEGRDVYKFVNKDYRLLDARIAEGSKVEHVTPTLAARKASEWMRASGNQTALVLTGQFTTEEYEALVKTCKNDLGVSHIYHWMNNPEKANEFDGILNRGDKNPNTKGLQQVLAANGIKTQWGELEAALANGQIQTVVVAGPENQKHYSDLKAKLGLFAKAKRIVWLSACKNEDLNAVQVPMIQIPLKTFVEKNGTFVNFNGLAQKIHKVANFVPNSLTLSNVADLLAGRETVVDDKFSGVGKLVHNEFTQQRGAL